MKIFTQKKQKCIKISKNSTMRNFHRAPVFRNDRLIQIVNRIQFFFTKFISQTNQLVTVSEKKIIQFLFRQKLSLNIYLLHCFSISLLYNGQFSHPRHRINLPHASTCHPEIPIAKNIMQNCFTSVDHYGSEIISTFCLIQLWQTYI